MSALQGMTSGVQQLVQAVHELAKEMLGEEVLGMLMDSAVEGAMRALHAAVAEKVPRAYVELADAVSVQVGAFIAEYGVGALESELRSIVEAGSADAMQRQMVAVCCKVAETVLSEVMERVVESALEYAVASGVVPEGMIDEQAVRKSLGRLQLLVSTGGSLGEICATIVQMLEECGAVVWEASI